MAVASPQMLIAELRRWLARMESHGRASAAVLPFGLAEVDAHVPGGGLQLGHLHEVIEGGAASEYAGLATLFAAGVVARLPRPVLWCLRGRDLFAPAALLRQQRRRGRDISVLPPSPGGLRGLSTSRSK
jgi:protein ImuA